MFDLFGVGMRKEILFVVLFLCGFVLADPAVSSVSGTVEHGGSIVIGGSDFGVKSPAAPLMWDDGEGKTINDPDVLTTITGYSEAWPDNRFAVRDQWKLQYRNQGFRSVAGAHAHSSNYITGGHWSDHEDLGRNVVITTDSGTFPNEWYASWYVRLDPQWPTYSDACTLVPNYKDFVFQTGAQSYTYPPGEGIFRYSACTQCIARAEALIGPVIQPICGVLLEDPVPRPSELFGWKRREVILRNSPGIFDTFSYDGTIGVQAFDATCSNDLVDYGIRSFSIGGFARNSDSSQPNNPPYDYPNWSPIRDLTDHWYTWIQRGTSDVYYATFNGADVGDFSQDPWIKVSPFIVRIGGTDSRIEGDIGSLGYGEWVYGDFDALGYNTMYARLPEGTTNRNPGDNGPCYLILTDDRQSEKGNGRTHPDAFRYFDDIYIDTTWSRVVLADNADYDLATIVEPQIPSAWSSSSITATMNLGQLPDSGTAYMFVFDVNDVHNAIGYPVTVGQACEGVCVSGLSDGNIGHEESLTISGSGFGVKSPAAPVLFDDGSDNTKLNEFYTQAEPSLAEQGSIYNMQYRDSVFLADRGMSVPHQYATYVLGGAHACSDVQPQGDCNLLSGNSVHLLIAPPDWPLVGGGQPKFYLQYWYRYDPSFDEVCTQVDVDNGICSRSPGGENCKQLVLSNSETNIFASEWGYYQICNGDCPDVNSVGGYSFSRASSDLINSHSACSGNEVVHTSNPVNQWIQMMWLGDYDIVNDNPTAEWTTLPDHRRTFEMDDHKPLTTYEINSNVCPGNFGCPDNSNYESVGIGSFSRVPRLNNGVNSFRYFAGVYMDTTYARIVLADNADYDLATIIEPQIPSSWSGDSVTVTTNLGGLTSNAYLFVFDADNNHNDVGYPVSLSGGAGSVCGDGSCDGGETCVTCVLDCGDCSCVHVAEIEPCDGVVDISEIVSYIDSWEIGSVSIGDVLGAVNVWKFG